MADQKPAPPTAPRPNTVLSEPATVAACQRDYQAGATARAESEKRDAKRR